MKPDAITSATMWPTTTREYKPKAANPVLTSVVGGGIGAAMDYGVRRSRALKRVKPFVKDGNIMFKDMVKAAKPANSKLVKKSILDPIRRFFAAEIKVATDAAGSMPLKKFKKALHKANVKAALKFGGAMAGIFLVSSAIEKAIAKKKAEKA